MWGSFRGAVTLVIETLISFLSRKGAGRRGESGWVLLVSRSTAGAEGGGMGGRVAIMWGGFALIMVSVGSDTRGSISSRRVTCQVRGRRWRGCSMPLGAQGDVNKGDVRYCPF